MKKQLGRSLAVMIGLTMIIMGIANAIHPETFARLWGETFNIAYHSIGASVIALVIGCLLLFQKSYRLGVLLLTVALWGILAMNSTRLPDSLFVTTGSIILLSLLWLSAILYRPELFDRLEGESHETGQEGYTI